MIVRKTNFDLLMGKNRWWCFENFSSTLTNSQRYKFFKKLYNKNFVYNKKTTQYTKFPKKIHQIWLGSKKRLEKFSQYTKSWKKHHPNWEYILWDDDNVKNFKFKYLGKFFEQSNNYGQKADLLRYELLFQYGGIYADVDFECLTSFDLLNSNYHFFCGLHPPHKIITPNFPLEVGNALIGASVDHPIILETMKLISKRWKKIYELNKYDDNWKIVLSGWYPFRDGIIRAAYKENLNNIVMPASYFYPFLLEKTRLIGNNNIGKAFSRTDIRNETMAIHHWGESWFDNFIRKTK